MFWYSSKERALDGATLYRLWNGLMGLRWGPCPESNGFKGLHTGPTCNNFEIKHKRQMPPVTEGDSHTNPRATPIVNDVMKQYNGDEQVGFRPVEH